MCFCIDLSTDTAPHRNHLSKLTAKKLTSMMCHSYRQIFHCAYGPQHKGVGEVRSQTLSTLISARDDVSDEVLSPYSVFLTNTGEDRYVRRVRGLSVC